MAIHDWWATDASQRYWLETTKRTDIGSNLWAPTEDDRGNANPGYTLVNWVADGDVVFHWDTKAKAIVSWSLASGGVWTDRRSWASVPGGGEAYERDAWVHGLDGAYELPAPVTLNDLRAIGEQIGELHDRLVGDHGSPLYFPFSKYAEDWGQIRTGQPYLTKFPRELVDLLGLAETVPAAPGADVHGSRSIGTKHVVGGDYVTANENPSTTERDPFSPDPSVVDRGNAAHAVTQNALSKWVASHGWNPLRPVPPDPRFDLAWRGDGETLFVAEVKSLTTTNEEKQLRLGLGQVLRYRNLLSAGGQEVVAVLSVEREPSDSTWSALCASLAVRLVWPPGFEGLDD